jgi:hypothetical protein
VAVGSGGGWVYVRALLAGGAAAWLGRHTCDARSGTASVIVDWAIDPVNGGHARIHATLGRDEGFGYCASDFNSSGHLTSHRQVIVQRCCVQRPGLAVAARTASRGEAGFERDRAQQDLVSNRDRS